MGDHLKRRRRLQGKIPSRLEPSSRKTRRFASSVEHRQSSKTRRRGRASWRRRSSRRAYHLEAEVGHWNRAMRVASPSRIAYRSLVVALEAFLVEQKLALEKHTG